MKRISSCLAASIIAATAVTSGIAHAAALPKTHRIAASGSHRMSVTPAATPHQAFGVGINLDVVGRLTGSGNTLFRTAVDISNNTNTPTQVDAFFEGTIGGQHVSLDAVSITANGIVGQAAQLLADHSIFHSDDFIDDLRAAGLITQAEEDSGVLGSLFVIYDSPSVGLFDQIGQGSVQARFYSSAFGGTIGVSANGHELTTSEPVSLVGIGRDTIGEANTPQVTTNFFINNEGYASAVVGHEGELVDNPVTVRMSGFSNVTGNPLPHTFTFPIGKYETAAVGNLYSTLGASIATDGDSIIVFFDIVSGNSAISGLSSTNDFATKDPSAAQLRPADWTHGR